jgi:hypothetical protein
MTTLSTLNADATPRAAIRRLTKTRLVRFLATYLEMTVSMVIGMQILGVIWDAVLPGVTGRPDVMAVTMAFDMTVGMAAWMWVRRHAPRHIAEMAAVMVLPFLVLLVPYWLGVLPGDALLSWGHVGMFALMAVYLAWRPHAGHAPSAHLSKGHPRRLRPALTASILLVAGASLALLGGILHPHEELPNSHVAVFTEYAHSTDWVWIHDLQFFSAAVVVAGFLILGRALQQAGAAAALVRVGYAAGAATAALIGVNMAVDGVALKRAVDAWALAGPEDQASRFAAAEAVRWLEWGVNSFFTISLGITLMVFAAALLRKAHLGTRIRLAGVTGTLAGALLIVNGLAVGAHGFEPTTLPLVATGLYVVMALAIAPLDRAVQSRRPAKMHSSDHPPVPA